MSKKRIGIITIALMLLTGSIFITACNGGSTSGGEKSNTLIYGSGDYTSINPALYEHGEINSLLFAGLTAHDGENKVVPALAEGWEWDAEKMTYIFKLKPGLTFHDGEALTSEDVLFTLNVIIDEDNASEIASNYEEITDMEATDDLTVKIALSEPNAAFPDYMTIGILPEHLFDDTSISEHDFNTNPVGAGPFMLKEWDMGQSITMEKFTGYFAGEPKLDQVIFKIVEDYDQRALQLKSGDLDFAQITPKASEEMEKAKGIKVDIMDTADYRGIMYNFNNDFWKENSDIIPALNFAIDREAIVESVLLGYGEAAYSPLQKSEYNNPDIEKYEFDPLKTREMLESAGWQIGDNGFYQKDGNELSFTINNGQGDQVRVDMANIAVQNLRDIGINATAEIHAEVDWANQDSYLIGWGSPFDPDDHTYKVFGTDQGANYSGYSNKEVDDLLKEARQQMEPEKRKPLYGKFLEELAEHPAYTFIAYIDAIYAGNENLIGLTKDTVLGHHGVGVFWNIHQWEYK